MVKVELFTRRKLKHNIPEYLLIISLLISHFSLYLKLNISTSIVLKIEITIEHMKNLWFF
jgi:hypothetical protein